ncbi:hypothetical protein Kpol_457p10 [Vanderwaltozyma polyspora DSM 70294]|uniref:Derlin n=1 Tax=Vanderwaltozyma polyspora (strain ATCC 22028 / DSM 70294 / BCRC 21397 / CBS 2163 / NBRC 10782 / NRRL Y-8283 / UCD 57-17) TaxID=436907 RepID=A7TQV1_VANPO|nr:uncharacterized protein Kpol_457p10 [Vanderwaltozyma polyspora DSM 70294]EDO15359.1 hypothetical protein Kpol_457p10 [Vanderwaltozyma polyspora DSM 70294]
MDAIVQHIFGDIPLVTKIWTIGCLIESIMIKAGAMDRMKLLYSFDLVFKKGQFERIIFSLFDYGDFAISSLVNLYFSTLQLSDLENSFNNIRRYLWVTFLMTLMIIYMTIFTPPVYSLGTILHDNLTYYQLQKNGNRLNLQLLGGINISPMLIPLYTNMIMYFAYDKSLAQVTMMFLPGHIVYYTDCVLSKLYDIDLLKTPYDWWQLVHTTTETTRVDNTTGETEND